MKLLTTAPVDYDYSTVASREETDLRDLRGRTVYLITLDGDPTQNRNQIGRYESGLHKVMTEAELEDETKKYKNPSFS